MHCVQCTLEKQCTADHVIKLAQKHPTHYEATVPWSWISRRGLGSFYYHGWTLFPACISNHRPYKVWNKITYPFPNLFPLTQINTFFSKEVVEGGAWMRNHTPSFIWMWLCIHAMIQMLKQLITVGIRYLILWLLLQLSLWSFADNVSVIIVSGQPVQAFIVGLITAAVNTERWLIKSIKCS